MLIPSIDLMGGRIVQLVQGEKPKLAFDDFGYWMERFAKYPLVQLIDLDAAKRQGENRGLIEMICGQLPCQVGGGLRTAADGRRLLEAGAKRVIYGSSLFGAEPTLGRDKAAGEVAGAKPTLAGDRAAGEDGAPGWVEPLEFGNGAEEFRPVEKRRHKLIRLEFAAGLEKELGEEQLCFAVDTKGGRVAVRGWKESVDLTPEEAVTWLEDYCAAFLYTHVDTEGTMSGFPMDVAAVLRATTGRQLIVAGGIRERREVEELDAMGVDAVAGMAVYAGAMEALGSSPLWSRFTDMQFAKRLREGVRRGEITCTVRIWMSARVTVGGRYRMEEGEVEVDSIEPIGLPDITPGLARASGFLGVLDLLKVAKHGRGEKIYLIRFHYVPPGRKARGAAAKTARSANET